jgi:hypothetical protein
MAQRHGVVDVRDGACACWNGRSSALHLYSGAWLKKVAVKCGAAGRAARLFHALQLVSRDDYVR